MAKVENCDIFAHEIRLLNIQNNEELSYNLLLINGEVFTRKSCKCKQNKIKIYVNNNNNYIEIEVIDSYFKHLQHLAQGMNLLIFEYCNTQVELSIEFRPRKTNFYVLPLYIICKNDNGHFQSPDNKNNTPENACKRISCVTRLVQTFYAEKLHELGFSRKTFQFLNVDAQMNPVCSIFHSNLDVEVAREMNDVDLWLYFGREIMSSPIGRNNLKYLAILSCTRYNGHLFEEAEYKNYEYIKSLTDAYAALGGGGLALFGSGCLYTWPECIEDCISCLTNETSVDRSQFMDDSSFRGTYGGCFSTTLGAICHELGHCFDLGHTKTGVMGRGFDNIYRVFCISKQKNKNVNFNNMPKQRTIREMTLLNINDERNYKTKLLINDFTFFTRNCALILNYHRWFNSFGESISENIVFDREQYIIKSDAGIKVIEIRVNDVEEVTNWWEFSNKNIINKFALPKYCRNLGGALVVAVDNVGNVLKKKL